jgi:hypothetical protein
VGDEKSGGFEKVFIAFILTALPMELLEQEI